MRREKCAVDKSGEGNFICPDKRGLRMKPGSLGCLHTKTNQKTKTKSSPNILWTVEWRLQRKEIHIFSWLTLWKHDICRLSNCHWRTKKICRELLTSADEGSNISFGENNCWFAVPSCEKCISLNRVSHKWQRNTRTCRSNYTAQK